MYDYHFPKRHITNQPINPINPINQRCLLPPSTQSTNQPAVSFTAINPINPINPINQSPITAIS
jgi:hypothetical protein